jgi:uncharacterized phage protein (TIGR02220 family)
MLNKELLQKMFAKGKEREVLLFAYLYANCFDGWSISAVEIESRFGIPKTSLHRIMERKWNESGMEMEWKWNKGSLLFSKIRGKSGTEVERKWNGSGTEVEQKVNLQNHGNTQKTKLKSKQRRVEEVEFVVEVVNYLNTIAGKNYKPHTASTKRLIQKRRKEGFEINDFKKVIDFKAEEWLNTENDQYLRPQTLFGGKFEGYLNAKKPKHQQTSIKFHSKISRNDQYEIATERARKIDYGTLANPRKGGDDEDA